MQVDFDDAERLARAKRAFTTRRVDPDALQGLSDALADAAPGDLLLARVDRLGHHKGLQLISGRRAELYPGDEIVLCVGHRYAPDQFEAYADVSAGACHLVAAGGLAGTVRHKHEAIAGPTQLTALALVTDGAGRRVNIRDHALPAVQAPAGVPVIAVLGTAMNAGKTTAAASLVKGLSTAGLRVGAAKITGTGAGGDYWAMTDAGAHRVLDFTDAGFASTYQVELPELCGIFSTLAGHLAGAGCEAIVIEVADGVFQRETAILAGCDEFRMALSGVLFAAPDALSAVGGHRLLHEIALPLLAVTGRFTQSPLACGEAAGQIGVPVLSADQLRDGATAAGLLFGESESLAA